MRFTIKAKAGVFVSLYIVIFIASNGRASRDQSACNCPMETLDEVRGSIQQKRLQSVQQLNIISCSSIRAAEEPAPRQVPGGSAALSSRPAMKPRKEFGDPSGSRWNPTAFGRAESILDEPEVSDGEGPEGRRPDLRFRSRIQCKRRIGALQLHSRQHAQELVTLLEDGVQANVERMDNAKKEADTDYNTTRSHR